MQVVRTIKGRNGRFYNCKLWSCWILLHKVGFLFHPKVKKVFSFSNMWSIAFFLTCSDFWWVLCVLRQELISYFTYCFLHSIPDLERIKSVVKVSLAHTVKGFPSQNFIFWFIMFYYLSVSFVNAYLSCLLEYNMYSKLIKAIYFVQFCLNCLVALYNLCTYIMSSYAFQILHIVHKAYAPFFGHKFRVVDFHFVCTLLVLRKWWTFLMCSYFLLHKFSFIPSCSFRYGTYMFEN